MRYALQIAAKAFPYFHLSGFFFFFLDNAEIVFLTIFFVEVLLKLYGLGIHQYFSSSFNIFDFAVSIFLCCAIIPIE